MSNGHHFISYSSADALDFALKLHDALEAGPPSYSIWLDKRDLRPGDDWDEQIDEAIQRCESLLFVMTADSVEKQSVCKREWSRALSYKKPVVPLLLHPGISIPFRLEGRQHIDFTSDFDTSLAKLRNHLDWLRSPQGEVQAMEERLADARRELRRADAVNRGRIEDEIDLLEKQIADEKSLVQDPDTARRRTAESISQGLEQDRRTGKPIIVQAKSKFINPPPGIAPAYFQDRLIETGLIGDFLKDPALRLAIVVGRGGIGKTALVCRLLKSLEAGRLPDTDEPLEADGIVYLRVDTGGQIMHRLFSDLCQLLPHETAQALEVLYKEPQTSVEAKVRALLAQFPKGRMVVLLDNFEDIVDTNTQKIADDELDKCLRTILSVSGHGVKVILTTRITPRDLLLAQPPGRQMQIELDAGLESPFAENVLRAMDRDGKLGLRDAPSAILSLARERTGGYPRALEALVMALYADRGTSLDEMLQIAGKYLPENVTEVLVGEAFNRLDLAAQRVMQALAIFHRPVTPTAIDYLLQPYLPGINSALILARLVNMHFVRRSTGRYYLHPVDLGYTLSLIPTGNKSDVLDSERPQFTQFALRHRGAEYFVQVRKPSEEWKTIDDLAAQLAEFDLRLATEEYDSAARVLLEIDANYLIRWGLYRLVVDMHEPLQGKIEDQDLKRASVGNLGSAYRNMGQLRRAITYQEQALAIARQMQNRRSEMVWLGNLGNCYYSLGQTVRAIEHYEQVLVVAREIGDERRLGIALGNLGNCYMDLGQTTRAIDLNEQALAIAQQIGDRLGEGIRLSNLTGALTDTGRYDEAIRYGRENLHIADELGSSLIGSFANTDLAYTYLLKGELATARQFAEATRKWDEPQNNHNALTILGIIALRQRDQLAAREAFPEAVNHANVMIERDPQNFDALDAKGVALCGMALCEGNTDRISAALESIKRARAINEGAGTAQGVKRLVDELTPVDQTRMLQPVKEILAKDSRAKDSRTG